MTGIVHALSAYILWGFFPVYWKWLQHVPAMQLFCHRIVWSFLSLGVVIGFSHRRATLRQFSQRQVRRTYTTAALLIGANWLVYVWAVNAGFIVEASLGYFINPLLSIALGVVAFRERLRPGQWVAVGLAGVGVVYLTVAYGRVPWIALTLAFCFALYGMVKKRAPLGALEGLVLETGLLFLPALAYLLIAERVGQGAFLHGGLRSDLLLIGAGPVTALPLLMFSAAAQRIPLSLVGILQYIAPTLQFLLGVLVYREPFPPARRVGFGIVWLALVIFMVDGLLARQQSHPAIGG